MVGGIDTLFINIFLQENLTKTQVKSDKELMDYFDLGDQNRTSSETAMNKKSSRSHSFFIIWLERIDPLEQKKITAQLNIVDLAGSENVKRSQVEGINMKEAIAINEALSALRNVIKQIHEVG